MTDVLETKPRASDLETHGGYDKIQRWGWDLRGKPAEFAWLPKHNLLVDRSYQRAAYAHRIQVMARSWDWVACGAIIVALRSEGEWFVIDGQHRVEAARRRSDIDTLPCLIFEVNGIKAEAAGFLSSNTGRRPVTYVERFNALIQAEDPVALRLEGIIDGSGRKIAAAPGPGTISCVASLMSAMRDNEDALRRIWPVVLDVMRGDGLEGSVLRAFLWLELSLEPGLSLADKKWRDRAVAIGGAAIRREITTSAVLRGKGSDRACGMGLLAALNKGLRNHLVLRPDRAERFG